MVTFPEAETRVDFLIDNNFIVINESSPSDGGVFEAAIRSSLISLYASSDYAAETIELSTQLPQGIGLIFQYGQGSANYSTFTGVITVDPLIDVSFVRPDGTVSREPFQLVLIHEIFHAFGYSEVDFPTSGLVVPAVTYTGEAVDETNKVALEIYRSDQYERVTYFGPGDKVELPDGQNSWSFGNEIDVALYARFTTRSDGSIDPNSPGPDISTAKNTSGLADVIVGWDERNTIRAGMGNDYIYGHGGQDELEGGGGWRRLYKWGSGL